MTQKTKSMLVVDDDPIILDLVLEAFSGSEFQVLTARDGVAAMKHIDAGRTAIDVLLIDVVMPRLNGAQLARVIHYYYPAIKTIFMSGYPQSVVQTYGVPACNMRYIGKPFAPDTLIKMVRDELAG